MLEFGLSWGCTLVSFCNLILWCGRVWVACACISMSVVVSLALHLRSEYTYEYSSAKARLCTLVKKKRRRKKPTPSLSQISEVFDSMAMNPRRRKLRGPRQSLALQPHSTIRTWSATA
ncbi:hypothetical protein V8C34DRAFT_271438 [Trichoderma compactum]